MPKGYWDKLAGGTSILTLQSVNYTAIETPCINVLPLTYFLRGQSFIQRLFMKHLLYFKHCSRSYVKFISFILKMDVHEYLL